MSVKKKEYLHKILVVGNSGTGKTSLIQRYVHGRWTGRCAPTVGVDFSLKELAWDEQTKLRLQLWDLAGQDRFQNLTRVYYKEAVGSLMVYDVTRRETLQALLKWKEETDTKVFHEAKPIPVVVLANKADLVDSQEMEHMDDFCKKHGFLAWYPTSAKENLNIEKAVEHLVTEIMKIEADNEAGKANAKPVDNKPKTVSLSNAAKKKQACCA